MNRLLPGLAACLLLAAPATRCAAQVPAELASTARYTASLQRPDGGFAPAPGQPSDLGATSAAVRVLKYTGGSVPDVLACIRFVRSCYVADPGGFAPRPSGTPDVRTTAVGLIAAAELKITEKEKVDACVAYLTRNAKDFEAVRIAAAGLEAVGRKPETIGDWVALINQERNADGTFGEGLGMARETGSRAVTLLRLGVDLDQKAAILEALRKAQRPDGAWGEDGPGSDLYTTYRVMRFFHMTGEAPDLDRLRAFIARCAMGDGSYRLRPGGEATVSTTYNASIVLSWARVMTGEPALVETAGFRPLYNGQDLSGWEGDATLWSSRDGILTGDSPGIKQNQFLVSELRHDDFVLRLTFRIRGGVGNSGVMFRAERVPGTEMTGYQADIGEDYWGCLYDESRRNRVLARASAAALKALRKEKWNQYVIDAKGDHIRLSLNGVGSIDYHEPEPGIEQRGRLAVQIHSGGPMKAEFKDVYLQALPRPTEAGNATPGFFLKTLSTQQGDRKYTLYVPTSYDGSKPMPVVLFLHGSGERGTDGVKPAQTGIGPAVLLNKDAFQAIAVIPQARTTWAAGSDDAKAALAALDAVMKDYRTDPKRVVLTGLSMGGHGAWEMAAAEPGRFAAVVPICGGGRVETAKSLATLPVWAFCGDADRESTVLNLRAMVEAINTAGGHARLTEYRAVGHNSWDRAYDSPELITWLLGQKRP